MPNEVTKEMIDRYIKDNGRHCLFCGSANIETIEVPDFDGTNGTETIACEDCGKIWIANVVLKITGISLLDYETAGCDDNRCKSHS